MEGLDIYFPSPTTEVTLKDAIYPGTAHGPILICDLRPPQLVSCAIISQCIFLYGIIHCVNEQVDPHRQDLHALWPHRIRLLLWWMALESIRLTSPPKKDSGREIRISHPNSG